VNIRHSLATWPVRVLLAVVSATSGAIAQPAYHDFEAPPHSYWQRTPEDRFTRLRPDFESGKIELDRSSEQAFLLSVLRALEVPPSSQMLVFSTTSLQLSLISPANPRALYFNEDVYVGHVPGGRIEIVSLDPELGAIFYIFDNPLAGQPLRIERSTRCMNCHADEDSGHVPGLVIKSVVPGPRGGSLIAFRVGASGHGVPMAERFGGWHVTGASGFTNHWGNLTGRLAGGELTTFPNPPGERFNFDKYPVPTSDLLPQLLHEHQAGFVNRVVEASYRARTILHANGGRLSADQITELDDQARIVTRYLLFAGEAPLPAGGIAGEATYRTDFLRNRRATKEGLSLKDFELRTRLFQHRCSYMIYSVGFTGLPSELKQRVYRELDAALNLNEPHPDYAYLPAAEKRSIREILRETLVDLPAGW
jgi:hypothetical protein